VPLAGPSRDVPDPPRRQQGIPMGSSVEARLIIPRSGSHRRIARRRRGSTQPENFSSITNRSERSRAVHRASRVLQHPRCLNCHPVGERPTRATTVIRIPAGGTRCGDRAPSACAAPPATRMQLRPSSVPGHPLWHVAPKAWRGRRNRWVRSASRSGPEAQRRQDARGDQEHMARDSLVGWARAPGGNRSPLPERKHSWRVDRRVDRDRGSRPAS
jgi:hypothetical protein